MKPAVFLDLTFDAAQARAREEGRVFLVNVTASDSAECQEMDRTTWSDPKVAERIAEGAIAIQIDIAADKRIANMLVVDSAPAVVAHDRGGYVGHRDGALTPAELLAWFDEIALGKTFRERRQGEVKRNPSDTFRRLQLADSLRADGKLEEATAEYVWLWKHMLEHEPKMAGIKHSNFVTTLKKLADAHPPAREAFTALRPASPPSLDAPDAIAFADWWSLNKILGEEAKTLAWFDDHRERALAAEELAQPLVEHIEPLLLDADRWSDVASLYKDPVAKFVAKATLRAQVIAESAQISAMAPPGLAAEGLRFTLIAVDEDLRGTAYKLVRVLRAAGREDEAKQIADAATAADASAEMAAALEGRYTALKPEELIARAKASK